MLVRSLKVENFRALRQADLSFGPGLNVLFGPNDLGKSSLAEAMRAAFLLQFSSADSREFVPWGTDLIPSVEVEFEVNGTLWKITKTFGSASRGAYLSRPGEEARGRYVEGKLREILAWGVQAPGGKGAQRGFPESYLTTALLGRQDKVTAILERSLDDDRVDTGCRSARPEHSREWH